jgi:hypothetical protein
VPGDDPHFPYGEQAFGARKFKIVADGRIVSGVADNAATIGGRNVAIEAKFCGNWATSLRNPASPIGQAPFAQAEQLRMVSQARNYAAAFDEVIYYSNNQALIDYYSKVFADQGIDRVKFVFKP